MTHAPRCFNLMPETVSDGSVIAAVSNSTDELQGDHALHPAMLGLVNMTRSAAAKRFQQNIRSNARKASLGNGYLFEKGLTNTIHGVILGSLSVVVPWPAGENESALLSCGTG